MATPTHGKNDHRLGDLLEKAKELGALAARGKDTIVQFGLLVANAAYDGVLDVTKDKHGDGVDDAVHAYSEYERSRAGANVFDHKSPSGKVQASKLRSLIKLGGWTRGGPGEPIATMNKLMGMRHNMLKTPSQAKLLDDPYNTLLKFARFQVKQNSVIDDDHMLRQLCLRTPSKTKTLEEYLSDTAKRLEDLRTGRAASSTLQHSSDQITHAILMIRAEVTELRKPQPEPLPALDDTEDDN